MGMVHPVPCKTDDHDTFDTPPRETPDSEASAEQRRGATPGPEIGSSSEIPKCQSARAVRRVATTSPPPPAPLPRRSSQVLHQPACGGHTSGEATLVRTSVSLMPIPKWIGLNHSRGIFRAAAITPERLLACNRVRLGCTKHVVRRTRKSPGPPPLSAAPCQTIRHSVQST